MQPGGKFIFLDRHGRRWRRLWLIGALGLAAVLLVLAKVIIHTTLKVNAKN